MFEFTLQIYAFILLKAIFLKIFNHQSKYVACRARAREDGRIGVVPSLLAADCDALTEAKRRPPRTLCVRACHMKSI